VIDISRRLRRVASIFASAAVVLVGLVVADAGLARAQDASLVAAATKEGEVVWYATIVRNQAARPLAEAFEKKYPGIKVRLHTGTQNDVLLKILDEGRAGGPRVDVSHGGSAVGSLLRAGLLERFVPAAASRYPAAYKDPDGYWTGEILSFLVAAINTETVRPEDEPRSYEDLLDPKWRGKMAWSTQMTQGGPPGFIGTVLETMGQDAGMQYLRQLAQQRIVNVPANQRVVLDQVIAGQYPLALMTFNHHSEISAKKGAPVKWLKIEPVTATVDAIFLIKHAPHPNAGKLFIEFALSSEGQTVLRNADYIPADPSTPALLASLKPETGNFKAAVLAPKLVEEKLPAWIQVYNDLFK
jgi:ABC-type Fe3+ transport system substrate-binding protein